MIFPQPRQTIPCSPKQGSVGLSLPKDQRREDRLLSQKNYEKFALKCVPTASASLPLPSGSCRPGHFLTGKGTNDRRRNLPWQWDPEVNIQSLKTATPSTAQPAPQGWSRIRSCGFSRPERVLHPAIPAREGPDQLGARYALEARDGQKTWDSDIPSFFFSVKRRYGIFGKVLTS